MYKRQAYYQVTPYRHNKQMCIRDSKNEDGDDDDNNNKTTILILIMNVIIKTMIKLPQPTHFYEGRINSSLSQKKYAFPEMISKLYVGK